MARQITRRSKSIAIANGKLHHRSVTGAFQRCVSPEEGQAILREIHEGGCGHHAGSKSLVAKAFRHGFYWLTDHTDAVSQGRFNVVFLLRRAVRFYERFMKEIAAIMPALSLSWLRLFIMGFIG